MLIDFHMHAFPDAIAERAIESLKQGVRNKRGEDTEAYTDGTIAGLAKSLAENGVDFGVILPVATKPTQTDSINKFAKLAAGKNFVSFAGVFPGQEGVDEILTGIKEDGFVGVKIHPEFQRVQVDSPESISFFKKCEELGLYVTLHAGEDIGVDMPVMSAPKNLKNVLEHVKGDKIIAAHMGGWNLWDEVETYLVGTPVMFDTAFVADFLPKEQYFRMIRNHGSEKILFGSDIPWEKPQKTLAALEALRALGLTDDEFNDITYRNAQRILGGLVNCPGSW